MRLIHLLEHSLTVVQVVLAVARVFYYIAPPSQMQKLVAPLLRLLHISPEIERVVLSHLLVVANTAPVCLSTFDMHSALLTRYSTFSRNPIRTSS